MALVRSGRLNGPVGLAVLVMTVTAIVLAGLSALFSIQGFPQVQRGLLVGALFVVLATLATAAIGSYTQVEDEE